MSSASRRSSSRGLPLVIRLQADRWCHPRQASEPRLAAVLDMPFIDGCQRLHGLCVAMIPSASSAFPICRLCIEHTSAQSTCCICRRKQCWSRHCTKRSYSIDGTTLCVKCWSKPTLAAYVFGRPPPPDGPEAVIGPGEPITDLHLGSESSSSQETSGGDLESNADTSGTMVLVESIMQQRH